MASSGPVGAQEIGFPEGLIYGEWCGVDHPRDPDRAPPPTDEIDAACKKHDAAYGLTEPWGNSDADQELADTLTEILQRGTVWNIGADGRRESRTEMSSRQYRVAATIAAWMAGQSFPTLYSDIVNGKVSSVLKWGVSATEVVIAVPTKIAADQVGAFAEAVSEATGLPVDEVNVLEPAQRLVVKSVFKIGDLAEETVDAVGDETEAIVDTIGDMTGLDKPVRELKEELKLAFTHPKKAAKSWGQKVIDTVLPWRWD